MKIIPLILLLVLSSNIGFTQVQVISDFTLVNADNNQDIKTLANGEKLNLATLPTKNLNIRANTNPEKVGSVIFNLNGITTIENVEPYSFKGDTDGDYKTWNPAVGSYFLKATPFTKLNGQGTAGLSHSISFSIINEGFQPAVNQPPHTDAGEDQTIILPNNIIQLMGSATDEDGSVITSVWNQVTGPATASFSSNSILQPIVSELVAGIYIFKLTVTDNQGSSDSDEVAVTVIENSPIGSAIEVFTLINSDTGQEIETLSSGDELNLATLPTKNLNIRASTIPDQVGSVVFNLNGTLKTENVSPYLMVGDNNSWTPVLGDYTLTATPYTSSNGSGTPGAPLTVTFKVINIIPTENNQIVVVTGELKKWHKVTITFTGPTSEENAAVNPFLNYRLNVIFSKGSKEIIVPGYFAADGNAGQSGAITGNKWRVHFNPDEDGSWSYKVSFRTGSNIAVSNDSDAGNPVAFDGTTGTINIIPTDKTGKDFRAKGRLKYGGQHWLQFAQTGEYFLKGGADSPENFLAYREFDGTYSHGSSNYIKTYTPHVTDWKAGDPTWKGGKGKGIIGALNYLASKGMNSVYFLTMNVNGDGKDVWPWTSHTERYRFDVSKLDQWEVVFSQMDKLGIMMHVVTQETENDQLLDGGELGVQRKLYYRELVARFGHHLAINWNLGEENSNTDAQRKAFATYIKQIDPYDSYINVHTYPGHQSAVYTPLLGYPAFDGSSLQTSVTNVHAETIKWINQSAASGRKWVVNLDEQTPASTGVMPDAYDYDHDDIRKGALWGNLMAGGGGVEWYFGYSYPNSDLTAQDWRSRDQMWDLTRYALDFFHKYLPFWQMTNNNALTTDTDDYCLASPGKTYAVYLPKGGTTQLNLGTTSGPYQVKWYNPRSGGSLQNGSIQFISGSGNQSIGNPPTDNDEDWVCLITNTATSSTNILADVNTSGVLEKTGEFKPAISFYPNPIKNEITVQVLLPEEMILEISVIDVRGKEIALAKSAAIKSYTKNLDLSKLATGIYLLRVKYGDKQSLQRLVKY